MSSPQSQPRPEEPRLSLQYSFDATAIDVRAALKTLDGQLSACGLPRDNRGDIILALGEVLNNVVEHAYEGKEDGPIQLDLSVLNRSVAIQIVDHGLSLPGEAVPETTLPDIDVPVDDLPEGGFGWAILHQLATDISYRRKAGENTLSFQVPTVIG